MKFKICGIKNLETLDCCIANNVDFFGLIFYKKSPRNIEIKDAQKLIFSSKNKSISSVGVFVNEPIIQLQNLLKILKLANELNQPWYLDFISTTKLRLQSSLAILQNNKLTKFYDKYIL